ncbi:MAG: hypothetical protein L6R37_006512 [Teloschistes peruensis]|nr:MAG: hypothetical protein L6R37_006512 [Teloschistes peruensis]
MTPLRFYTSPAPAQYSCRLRSYLQAKLGNLHLFGTLQAALNHPESQKSNGPATSTLTRMLDTSPYGFIESEPPKWRSNEDRVASAFVGISFFLFFETIFEIFRVFKKRRGLYFWSLVVGVISCVINTIAITLKYLVPGSERVWPLYTLMALCSWTCYSLGQLVVLYSRLHLVLDNKSVQHWVLYLICACAFFFVVPIWIVVWPAWNTKKEITERWSAPDGIVERFTQLGFTMAECIVSGIYIHALVLLLRWKPTVRQRRVFLDLVYVNVITITLDILSALLVYLNQTGVSHPIQVFSYILKFRLEFVVLNQLMAVAARGLRRETFGEKRYHNDTLQDTSQWDQNLNTSDPEESGQSPNSQATSKPSEGETEIAVPAPVMEDIRSRSKSVQSQSETSSLPIQGHRYEDHDATSHGDATSRVRAMMHSLRLGTGTTSDEGGHRSVAAKRKKSKAERRDDDDDEDEIPLHMWERNGELVMRIPWFPEQVRSQA